MRCKKCRRWVKATPFRRDIVREVSQATNEAGLKFCAYYSDTDWRNPDFPAVFNPNSFHGNPQPRADMAKYLSYMKAQLRELLTQYGPLGILWFDNGGGFGGYDMGKVMHGQELVDLVHQLQPDCLVNNRAGVPGDYGTPEQEIPLLPSSTPWETCMTMNRHWGYNKNDQDWKSSHELICDLVDIVSKGGNFLLNVGPTPEGQFPPPAVERLKEIGDWMKVNGEAIDNTTATPFGAECGSYDPRKTGADKKAVFKPTFEWRCTKKVNRLYIHFLKWPGTHFSLPAIPQAITKAYFLIDPQLQTVLFQQSQEGVSLTLPAQAPQDIVPVLCLEIK